MQTNYTIQYTVYSTYSNMRDGKGMTEILELYADIQWGLGRVMTQKTIQSHAHSTSCM